MGLDMFMSTLLHYYVLGEENKHRFQPLQVSVQLQTQPWLLPAN